MYVTLYFLLILLSSFIAFSAMNFFMLWVAMEVSIFALMPMFIKYKSASINESLLKYFLIQISAGLLFLGSALFFNPIKVLMFIALMMKLGLFPFYLWVPHIYSGASFFMIFILSTFQKISPLFAISNILLKFSFVIAIMSIFVGSISGIFLTNIKKIMAFSSVSHSGWLLSLTEYFNGWLLYFLIYSTLLLFTLFYFSEMNFKSASQLMMSQSNFPIFNFWLLISSLAGLPPFAGFYLKWLGLSLLTPLLNNFIFIIVITFSLSLFFYLNIFILSTLSISKIFNKQMNIYSIYITMFNLFGLIFILLLV